MSRPRVAVAASLERLTPLDALVHLAIPALLVAVYLSPVHYESLAFRPGVDGVLESYTSLLGHATLGHLLGNVFGLALSSTLSLALLSSVSRRRRYYACFATILVLVPLLTALQWTLLLEVGAIDAPAGRAGVGFSVVTAAFVGLLAVSIATYQREALVGARGPFVGSCGLLALALAVVAVSSGLGWLALFAGATALATLRDAVGAMRASLREPGGEVAVSLAVVGWCVYAGAAVDLFAVGTGAVRAHVVGLSLGFALVWAVVGLERVAATRA
ncbi:hypothetical protein [Natronobiforma cellulositropha]|uniref:hypothetical protein n=1 Tax=Natronobiforma cellulositropha TaxID=1679076 RepID=UPI0021D5E7D5|nr:hypothetical protein [Natronobiforma cellulositropha]